MARRAWLAVLLGIAGCQSPHGAAERGAVSPDSKLYGQLSSQYATTSHRIVDAALADNGAYEKLERLCDDVGHRLSGSEALDQAIKWAADAMRADGLDNVRTEPVQVVRWVRGAESVEMIEPRPQRLVMLGLGGSIATPPEGITAEVEVVRDEAELDRLGTGAAGKIVLFNNAMPAYDPIRGSGYGQTVRFRSHGADLASDKGAVACLVRSVTAHSLRTPHTGAMSYGEGKRKIPAAAITIEDAAQIARLRVRGIKVLVRLKMEAHTEDKVASANVIGEIRGSTAPDEVVVVGGHIDSWDVGDGAHDDGAGCVMSMQALAVLKKLGLRPRRTIRCVLFTNEENGLAGGKQYALDHAAELKNHVAALESDSGGFRPVAIGISIPESAPPPGSYSSTRVLDAARRRREPSDKDQHAAARLAAVLKLLEPKLSVYATSGGGGADISPMRSAGVPQLGLDVDGEHYFDYHHTPADTLDKVNPRDLRECVATLAATLYVVADMPGRLSD